MNSYLYIHINILHKAWRHDKCVSQSLISLISSLVYSKLVFALKFKLKLDKISIWKPGLLDYAWLFCSCNKECKVFLRSISRSFRLESSIRRQKNEPRDLLINPHLIAGGCVWKGSHSSCKTKLDLIRSYEVALITLNLSFTENDGWYLMIKHRVLEKWLKSCVGVAHMSNTCQAHINFSYFAYKLQMLVHDNFLADTACNWQLNNVLYVWVHVGHQIQIQYKMFKLFPVFGSIVNLRSWKYSWSTWLD